jgi:hypothetical protein
MYVWKKNGVNGDLYIEITDNLSDKLSLTIKDYFLNILTTTKFIIHDVDVYTKYTLIYL